MDLKWIWEGFGEGLGSLVGNFSLFFWCFFGVLDDFAQNIDF